ncbi:MAG TPA: ABC transporter permease, partial [archaeon]|nr:ABC transporter permease [archaeon]
MKNLLSMACFNITHRKMRSFLTLLGIVIGVAAVIATLSLGIGMEKNLVEQLTKFQGDVLTLIPRKLTFQPG